MNDINNQTKILGAEVNPIIADLLHQHHIAKKIWYPSDLIPSGLHLSKEEKEQLEEIKQNSQHLPNAVRLALVLNMITEEGLPLFHRLLYEAFGPKSDWETWRDQWTAEEDQHGLVLRDYIRDFGICDMRIVEKMQFEYVAAGWAPPWRGDAYGTIAYTSIQERATQISHRNLSKLASKTEATLGRILAHLAGDESRHFNFYCSVLKKLVEVDIDNILPILANVMKAFTMPGINAKNFSKLAHVEHALGIFGPKEMAESITEVIKFTGLNLIKNVSAKNEKALQFILGYPNKLLKIHERFINQVKEKIKSYHFEMLFDNKEIIIP